MQYDLLPTKPEPAGTFSPNGAASGWLSVGFDDTAAAMERVRRMASDRCIGPALIDALPNLLATLQETADPDRALVNLERFASQTAEPALLFYNLARDPHRAQTLITVLSGSQFLAEILLRHPEHWERLQDITPLARRRRRRHITADLQALVDAEDTVEGQLDVLRRFQRWELLRIGTSDLLGLLDLPNVTAQLSNLADVMIRQCLAVAANWTGTSTEGFVVIALGKLGGKELNYSSDIDLLFLAEAEASRYRRLGEILIDGLAKVTSEGFLYRVDMRLRPWGTAGPLVSTVDSYNAYLMRHARLWEKQALLKTRIIAGDRELGTRFMAGINPLLFDNRPDDVRQDVLAMKQRIEAELGRQGGEWGEIKLGKGSIRDVEFVTQYLQLVYGASQRQVQSRNTLEGLSRLFTCGMLSPEEYRALADGYTFLRPVEHYLQMMQNRQTHVLPTDARELDHLARRLGFAGEEAGALLISRYQQHRAAIRAVYQHHLEAVPMETRTQSGDAQAELEMRRHLARMAPSYSAAFSRREIERHAEMAAHLTPQDPVRVNAAPVSEEIWRVTIVGYDYPGELSLICGLLFAHGFSIISGEVFTYEPSVEESTGGVGGRPKIVDVFNVRSVHGQVDAAVWTRYAEDLAELLRSVQQGAWREAHSELARRVAMELQGSVTGSTTLHPIEIEIDNDIADRYTVVRIASRDTVGFLYELTSALALSGFYIARVTVDSTGDMAHDTLYLTDGRGHKVTEPEQQRELRVATVLVKHFTHLLPQAPDPEKALLHFQELLDQLLKRPSWPRELASLERPEVLGALARLLGVSDFLWDDFLRMQHANLFPIVSDLTALEGAKSREMLQHELAQELAAAEDDHARTAILNAFKDREMFRVDMRHIQGHIPGFTRFSHELTDLAEVVIEAAVELCDQRQRTQYGAPCLADGSPSPWAVCALGKAGGRELGYASDIELMLVYAGNGETSGPERISTAEYYERLVIAVTHCIHARREGIFEIDLRLRPYGSAGSMAVSLDSFRRYFQPGGPAWAYERQSLIKLRPIAGDKVLGATLSALRDEYVYQGGPFDVAAMRAIRERQVRHLVAGGTLNAKFSPGGLVDVEYLVQALQITHGPENPTLRSTNTREAITALAEAGVLTQEDHDRLKAAHSFLRRLIDALRMVRGNARDLTVPEVGSEELALLARRMGAQDAHAFWTDLTGHMVAVQETGNRLFEAMENPG
ncbi:MAG: [protein-PII] uridylyltransferase family protein [Anaerolineae bacterium]